MSGKMFVKLYEMTAQFLRFQSFRQIQIVSARIDSNFCGFLKACIICPKQCQPKSLGDFFFFFFSLTWMNSLHLSLYQRKINRMKLRLFFFEYNVISTMLVCLFFLAEVTSVFRSKLTLCFRQVSVLCSVIQSLQFCQKTQIRLPLFLHKFLMLPVQKRCFYCYHILLIYVALLVCACIMQKCLQKRKKRKQIVQRKKVKKEKSFRSPDAV